MYQVYDTSPSPTWPRVRWSDFKLIFPNMAACQTVIFAISNLILLEACMICSSGVRIKLWQIFLRQILT